MRRNTYLSKRNLCTSKRYEELEGKIFLTLIIIGIILRCEHVTPGNVTWQYAFGHAVSHVGRTKGTQTPKDLTFSKSGVYSYLHQARFS